MPSWGPGAHLPQGYDEVAGILLLAGEADVVGGDEHLTGDVQLAEWRPQGAGRVAVQALIPRQAERGPVTLILGSGIQISGKPQCRQEGRGQELGFHMGSGLFGVLS